MRHRIFRTAVLAWCLWLVACERPPERNETSESVWFEEAAVARGLTFTHVSGASGEFELPEITGGGVALLDVENDGDLDVYFIQSGIRLAQVDDSRRNELFLNHGDGTFIKSTQDGDHAAAGYGMGVATADYDNDGDVDIYVTNIGPNALLRNDGSGRFTNVAIAAGVADDSWGTAASFADFDRDGDLDLYVVNYLHWDPSTALDCYATNVQTYCVPLHNYAAMDRIYENQGDGTFRNRTLEAGLASAFGNGLGVVSVDVNDDGWVDVFVANDSMVNQLWMNQGNFTFIDDAWYWSAAMDDHGIEKAGMGIVTQDFDEDGDFDVLVVNIEEQTDSYFRNEGNYFVDATGGVGLRSHSRRFTRFGLLATDFNHDACMDIYQANGSVYHDEEDLGKPDYFAEPNTLYAGDCLGGYTLVQPEGGTMPMEERTSRAAAVGDLNGDGFQDVVVVNKDGPASLFINQTATNSKGGFIRFRVIDQNGRDAYNARLAVKLGERSLTFRVQTDGSYLAAHDPHVHVGMNNHSTLTDVVVQWLGGEREAFGEFEANATYTLRQGEGDQVH
ncbi:MAG: CRTAC1 family protein [Gammaproteobacteria bacterium]|nr:CRTAC1 family protein [Gammaproteobacteria bacterium]